MTVAFSHELVGEFDAVALRNRYVRAVILPALGGRVWELEDRLRSRQWIWHRPGVPLSSQPLGAAYDDVWAGGWEELFPNDAPCHFEGRDLPDHGDWWTTRWNVLDSAITNEGARLMLRATSAVLDAEYTKTFCLSADAPRLSVAYAIHSNESRPFHFLFKQHLPVQLSPGCNLKVPGGHVHPVDPSFGTLLTTQGPFEWPCARVSSDRVVDLSEVPPRSSQAREFVYITNLPQPWCGVEDGIAKAALTMDFDRNVFPFVWLFLSYGGWRDVYTAVLEPCSNMPKDLEEAVQQRQSAQLAPGGVFETTVSVSLGSIAGVTA